MAYTTLNKMVTVFINTIKCNRYLVSNLDAQHEDDQNEHVVDDTHSANDDVNNLQIQDTNLRSMGCLA